MTFRFLSSFRLFEYVRRTSGAVRQRKRLKVAEHDTQVRDFVGEAHRCVDQIQPRIGHLQREARSAQTPSCCR